MINTPKSLLTRGTVLSLLSLVGLRHAQAQGILAVKPEFAHRDESKNLLLINASGSQLLLPGDSLRGLAVGGRRYTLAKAVAGISTRRAYQVMAGDTTYTAYFTRLPVIQIATPHPIVDAPSVYASFSLTDTSGVTTRAGLKIEVRGEYSQLQPKKSYELEFLKDTIKADKQDVTLLGMRNDNKWNLQAQYNDPIRLHLQVANEVWQDMHQLYYQSKEPKAINGIALAYTEVFLNGQYQGLYALTERVDRKQLRLEKYTDKIQGELYKGVKADEGTLFAALPNYDNQSEGWAGFEYKEPSEEIDWKSLHDFVAFVENSSDADFYAQYATRFNLENALDYFIFLNLMRIADNTGRNLYIAKYKPGEPYYYVPWDLDGVLGNDYRGFNLNITNDILTNGMYTRLFKDDGNPVFWNALVSRWTALRRTVLTQDAILARLYQNSNYLLANNVYEREHLAWPDYRYDAAQLTYPATWLADRLAYLDAYLKPRGGGALATKNEAGAAALQLYPNPASGTLNVTFGPGPYQLLVQDLSGRTLLQISVAGGSSRLSVGALPPGLYLVRTKSTTATAAQKLIVQ